MERTIFRYILSHSLKQQIVVLLLTLAALPFYFASLDLPKQIINKAIEASAEKFPTHLNMLGLEFGRFEQLELLGTLCGLFLFLVLVNGGFKYAINVYKGLLGERMLRRLRYQLFSTILKFPLSRFKEVSEAEMVSIISSEVEPLGGFIGDSFALPLYQGGMMLTALVFIFIQDLMMGLAVVALFPIQAVIIPRLQSQVNQLGKRRVKEVRRLSNDVADSVSLAREIRLNATEAYERAEFTRRLGRIFTIRYQIYRKKFFIKFLNNFIAQLTPLFLFSLGGYSVITGQLSIGALIAVLAANKDLSPPWKELLDFYQQQQDAQIKYEQIILRFGGQFSSDRISGSVELDDIGDRELIANKLLVVNEDGVGLHSIDFTIPARAHIAIIGPLASGKSTLAQTIAGLQPIHSGSLSLGNTDLSRITAQNRATVIGYADGSPGFLDRSLFDNLVYGLRKVPIIKTTEQMTTDGVGAALQQEAILVGNSPDDVETEWINYEALGLASKDDLIQRILGAINVVEMDRDLLGFGLRMVVSASRVQEISEGVIRAREYLRAHMEEISSNNMVELFDLNAFNDNATIGENIIFGESIGEVLDHNRLADNRYIRKVLRQSHLDKPLTNLGYGLAQKIALADMQRESMEMESLQKTIEADEMGELREIMARTVKNGVRDLSRKEKQRLQGIALCLVAARDDSGEINDEIRRLTLTARDFFASHLPADLKSTVALFDRNAFNPVLSIRENIVFGKIIDSDPASLKALNDLIIDAIDSAGIRLLIQEAGLEYKLGARAMRITDEQCQRLAIVRCLIKKPAIMVVNDAISGFDSQAQEKIIRNVREYMTGSQLIWVLQDSDHRLLFDGFLELQNGSVSGGLVSNSH